MDVLQLIRDRNEHFNEHTRKIYEEIPIIIEAIGIHLSSFPGNNYPDGVVRWEDINVFNDTLLLFGLLTYNSGTVLQSGNETMTVTEDNAEYLQQEIRIQIPAKIAFNQPVESIVQYLQETYIKERDQHTNLGVVHDFDLDGLSEEQIQAYILAVPSGTIN